jgi:hypothetical protein
MLNEFVTHTVPDMRGGPLLKRRYDERARQKNCLVDSKSAVLLMHCCSSVRMHVQSVIVSDAAIWASNRVMLVGYTVIPAILVGLIDDCLAASITCAALPVTI